MMKKFAAFLAYVAILNFAIPQAMKNAAAALSAQDLAVASATKNYATNGGAEAGKAGWTVSGTSAALTDLAVATAAASVYEGNASFTWTPANSDNYLSNANVTITSGGGLSGTNCAAVVFTKTTATDHILEAYDGTNVLHTATIPSSTSFVPVTLNWQCSTSGTNRVRLNAGSTTAITFDSLRWGNAYGINLSQAASVGTTSNQYTFTPSAGFGTTTGGSFWTQKIGDTLFVRGYFSNGTVAASSAYMDLPTGLAIDSSKIGSGTDSSQLGVYVAEQTASSLALDGGGAGLIFYDGSDTGKVFFGYRSGGGATFVKTNGSSVGVTGLKMTFNFSIPILGWGGSEISYRPDVYGSAWSGYHGNDCSFARTNAAYGNPTADATCTFTETNNSNFGTVTSYLSGSDKLPGLVFTPNKSGRYFVCVNTNPTGSSVNTGVAFKLTDGSSTITERSRQVNVATNYMTISSCGMYYASGATSKTLRLETKASSGTVTLANTTTEPTVEWTIFSIDQTLPAPLLAGSVTSNSSGLERIERARIAHSADSTCSITSQSGSWLDSVSCNSGGVVTINIGSGKFTSAPTCTCTSENDVQNAPTCSLYSTPDSATQIQAYIHNGTTTVNDNFRLICMGPR